MLYVSFVVERVVFSRCGCGDVGVVTYNEIEGLLRE